MSRVVDGDPVSSDDLTDLEAARFVREAARLLEERPDLSFVIGCPPVSDLGARSDLTRVLERPWFASSAMLFRRAAFDQLGGFDPSVVFGKELDLCLRLVANGSAFAIVDCPMAQLHTRANRDDPRLVAAAQQLFQRHRALFERDPAALLLGKEALLQAARRQSEAIDAQRVSLSEEVHQLERESERIRSLLAKEPLNRARREAAKQRTGLVLMYHRVATLHPDHFGLCIAPSEFRAQMQHLREAYTPMPLHDLVRSARSGDLPPRAVAVTLDDGTIDNLTEAAPILSEYQIPATFFITSEGATKGFEFWWDELERLLFGDGPLPTELALEVGTTSLVIPTRTRSERRAALTRIHGELLPLPRAQRDVAFSRLRAAVEPSHHSPRPSHRLLDAEELRQLATMEHVSIGAHSAHHLFLPNQSERDRRSEIAENRAHLERVIGRPMVAFSYPFGAHDPATAKVVRDCGFEFAVTAEERALSSREDPFTLPRVAFANLSLPQFAARMHALL